MKIGIMGGTFNPIHIGHLLLGEFAYEEFQLDEIWFLPNGNPPHKTMPENHSAKLSDRLKMIELAIKGNPHFKPIVRIILIPTKHSRNCIVYIPAMIFILSLEQTHYFR